MSEQTAILAAESDPSGSDHLARCLRGLGYEVRPASSSEAVLSALRERLFAKAVVAVELTGPGGGPLAAVVSRLPSVERLVVIGPGGDEAAERLARECGAQVYLARPVSAERLARALWPNPSGTYVPTGRRRQRI